MRSGQGIIKVNRKNIRDYYPDNTYRAEMLKPLLFSGTAGLVDVDFFVVGGGINAQADACCLALVRALIKFRPRLKPMFRLAGLVTQDPRFVERKHSGRYKARKSYTYVRR
jgi:small subunit ribosomal protein S9